MCGIAGFLDRSRRLPEAEAVVQRMVGTLQHRGPDDGGTWVDTAAGIALGHWRLAVVDLSPHGHQPMVSAGGRYWLAFNGEIYNFAELRRELAADGVPFRGHSDTEVVVNAIERWGLAAVVRFQGMFALAVWNRESRTLSLARDRMGEKPLYYGWMGSYLLFGSALRALRAHPAWKGEVDRGALALLLRYGYIPTPHSIYCGIRKLVPGAVVAFPEQTVPGVLPEPAVYWSVQAAAEAGVANPLPDDAAAAVDALEAVRRQMIADVPLGAFLSGGVDSSTVVALMQAESRTPVRTFTIGFHERRYDEAPYARAVARHLGTDHTELYLPAAEALAVISDLPALYDEPFADSSQIPTHLVSCLARRHVTVSLSGDGGDELFCGYDTYASVHAIWRRLGPLPAPLRRAMARAVTAGAAAGERWPRRLPAGLRLRIAGPRLEKLGEMLAVAGREAAWHRLVSYWTAPEWVVVAGNEPAVPLTDRAAWLRLPELRDWAMWADQVTYLRDDILVKLDRAAMAVSLETRVPFLDHRVVEFAWRLPLAMKVRRGQGKWLLRQLLHRYLPPELVARPKMGFGIPLAAWLRGPLRPWAEAQLDARRLAADGFFDPAPIRRKWSDHLAGRRDRSCELWHVLMIQAWWERHGGRARSRTSPPEGAR